MPHAGLRGEMDDPVDPVDPVERRECRVPVRQVQPERGEPPVPPEAAYPRLLEPGS